MFRTAPRSALRGAQSSLAPARTIAGRRFISTAPPHLKSRSWKSSAARWGIAIAGLYYYNTSPVFAEQPQSNLLNPNLEALEEMGHDHSTLETLTSRRQRLEQRNKSVLQSAIETTSSDNASETSTPISTDHNDSTVSSSPADLEEEAAGQGAFNEETGEINWDCPCLGGMAHGPCGPEFREAFSCFVFSKEEPKGMDCIEKFKGMQDCFQQHPEVYKGELEDDEDIDPETKAELQKEIAQRQEAGGKQATESGTHESAQRRLLEEAEPLEKKTPSPSPSSTAPATGEPKHRANVPASSEPHAGMSEEHEHIYQSQSSPVIQTPNLSPVEKFDEDLELMPKAWHDASDSGSLEKKTKN